MDTLFFASAFLGCAVLLIQLVPGLFGLNADVGGADAFHLLSIRSLAAGLAFFGVGGAAALMRGVPGRRSSVRLGGRVLGRGRADN